MTVTTNIMIIITNITGLVVVLRDEDDDDEDGDGDLNDDEDGHWWS